jgi:acyl-CoA thioesterase
MDSLKKLLTNDKFLKHNDIQLLEVSKGRAKAKLDVKDHHLNGIATVHGGAIFTLAELAFSAASLSYGTMAFAINMNISYVKAVSEGPLTAEAREVSINPKYGIFSVDIRDKIGDLIAVFQGLAYRKKDPLGA